MVKILEFDKQNSDKNLIEAIDYYVDSDINFNVECAPKEFLNKAELHVLSLSTSIPPISKYKALLFYSIWKNVKNKRLLLTSSYRYKAYDSYMIPTDIWNQNRDNYLEEYDLTELKDGVSYLNKIGQEVGKSFSLVNNNILNGDNTYFTKTDNIRSNWYLKNLTPDYSLLKFIPTMLDEAKSVPLFQLLSEVNSYSNFISCLENVTSKYQTKQPNISKLFATIVSLGTNIGHNNMAKATKNISLKTLRDTEKSWLNIEGLQSANDKIVNLIHSLSLSKVYDDEPNKLHSSSDGRKVVVGVNSLLANYSFKYYGSKQGVNINSFVDHRQSFFGLNVLSSSDREAPYLLDGIVEAKSTLFDSPDINHIHSSDTHGYTEAIFSGLHFLNVDFAPRIKNFNQQTLYAFEEKYLSKNNPAPLAPKSKIKKKLIIKYWDEMLRMMCSIKSGTCDASLMFKILSASAKDQELYKAFKEFGRLLKTRFLLKYIDDPILRKSIQKQLNVVELGQKLSKNIFFGREGKLHAGTESEIKKVMLCTNLIKNVIILWNYLFLSDYCLNIDTKDEVEFIAESIAKGSVISWAHINFHGTYDFSSKTVSSFSSTLNEMRELEI